MLVLVVLSLIIINFFFFFSINFNLFVVTHTETVKDLKGSVKYTFRVVAYSMVGEQTPSAPIEYKLVSKFALFLNFSPKPSVQT